MDAGFTLTVGTGATIAITGAFYNDGVINGPGTLNFQSTATGLTNLPYGTSGAYSGSFGTSTNSPTLQLKDVAASIASGVTSLEVNNLSLTGAASKMTVGSTQTLVVNGTLTNAVATGTNGLNGPGIYKFNAANTISLLTPTGVNPSITINAAVVIGASVAVNNLNLLASSTLISITLLH